MVWLRGALCAAGALGPGLAGLCLKTALHVRPMLINYSNKTPISQPEIPPKDRFLVSSNFAYNSAP